MKKFTITILAIAILAISLVLTSCGSINYRAENAGKALAEINCLAYSGDLTDMMMEAAMDTDPTQEILTKHGFESHEELSAYMMEVAGTSEFNELAIAVRTNLAETCGEQLEALGMSPEDLYESIVQE